MSRYPETSTKIIGITACILFLATIILANYSISHWGTQPFPGGPHMVTIFGWTAPSGVLFVGLSFTLRDIAQVSLGRWWILPVIATGALLSAAVADPAIALASGLAFGFSELCDWSTYTPLADRGHWGWAVTISNTFGSLIDSMLFLLIAFGSLQYLEGQFILKALMTIPALIVLIPLRSRFKVHQ